MLSSDPTTADQPSPTLPATTLQGAPGVQAACISSGSTHEATHTLQVSRAGVVRQAPAFDSSCFPSAHCCPHMNLSVSGCLRAWQVATATTEAADISQRRQLQGVCRQRRGDDSRHGEWCLCSRHAAGGCHADTVLVCCTHAQCCDYGFRTGSGRLYQDMYGEVPDNVFAMVSESAGSATPANTSTAAHMQP